MDYTNYNFSLQEKAVVLGEILGISCLVSYLFYDSFWGLISIPVVGFFIVRMERKKKIKARRDLLTGEFIDFLKNLSTALLAGYSFENAWKEGQKELGLMRGTGGLMYRELSDMNRQIGMNIPVEKVFDDFSNRCDVEEIVSFSEIFKYAKRSGGDFVRIVDSTTGRLSRKFETYREIDVSLASKKLEQKVMNFIPMFILAYMKITSPDYMGVLYEDLQGRIIMTVCLIIYGGALLLSEKITDISV